MFSGFKGKLLSIFSYEENSISAKDIININAGAPILQYFHSHWEELHELNEENAVTAKQLAKCINKISHKATTSKKNIKLINHILVNSNLVGDINNCLSSLEKLHKTSESIENKLNKLENLLVDLCYERDKNQDEYSLHLYEVERKKSLIDLKRNLYREYKRKLSEYEESRKGMMEERQRVFHDAFQDDLELYKNYGVIPGADTVKKENVVLLEEIELETDQKELEQFLNGNTP